MSFVGIISKIEDYEFIEKELLNKSSNMNLININNKNIQNIKNVKFETIVINDDLKEMEGKKDFVDIIINNTNFLIVNTDNNVADLSTENNKKQIITYGMNQKATVTASSIKEDEMLICLQRNIENVNDKIIEMQEFKKKFEKTINNDIYSILVIFILEQLYKWKKLTNLKKINFLCRQNLKNVV